MMEDGVNKGRDAKYKNLCSEVQLAKAVRSGTIVFSALGQGSQPLPNGGSSYLYDQCSSLILQKTAMWLFSRGSVFCDSDGRCSTMI